MTNQTLPQEDVAKVEDLADRVEAAAGPDRELDAAIWRLCDRHYSYKAARASGMWSRGGDRAAMEAKWAISAAPVYTASLDAAATLVPEGWGFQAKRYADGCGSDAVVWPDDRRLFEADAATPALALCAAALRARSHLLGEKP